MPETNDSRAPKKKIKPPIPPKPKPTNSLWTPKPEILANEKSNSPIKKEVSWGAEDEWEGSDR
jgi:hypothetical protein